MTIISGGRSCGKAAMMKAVQEAYERGKADAVGHAYWISHNCADPKWLRDDGKSVFIVCSHCEQAVLRNLMGKANYCPYCGYKMDGGKADE